MRGFVVPWTAGVLTACALFAVYGERYGTAGLLLGVSLLQTAIYFLVEKEFYNGSNRTRRTR